MPPTKHEASARCRRVLPVLMLLALCGCAGGRDRSPMPAADPGPAGPYGRAPFLPANPAAIRPRVNDPKPFNPDLRELRRRDAPPFYYEDMTVQHLLEFVPRAYRQRWLRRRDRWIEPAQE